jgi:hypothetical protein
MEIIFIWILINFVIKGDLIIDILSVNNFRFTNEIRHYLFLDLIDGTNFWQLRILGFEWIRILSIWFLIFHFTESIIVYIILLFVNWITFFTTSKSYSVRIIALDKKFNYGVVNLWKVFSVFCAVCLMKNISKLHFVILKIHIA